jgi:hypothetical protein
MTKDKVPVGNTVGDEEDSSFQDMQRGVQS